MDTGMSIITVCVILKILCISSGPFKFPVSTMHNYIGCIMPHWVILQHNLFRNLHPDCQYSCNDQVCKESGEGNRMLLENVVVVICVC